MDNSVKDVVKIESLDLAEREEGGNSLDVTLETLKGIGS